MAENKQIHISVRNKIAELVDKEQYLVCGNNDYEVVFDFDGDWSGINAKTAVFIYGNTPVHQPFVGNVCNGVEIKNATLCAIGVFAGDIKTTTGATIKCMPSIRDIGGVPKAPSQEVYDKIMKLLEEAIKANTELPKGGKKGQVLKKLSDKDYDTVWENDEVRDLSDYQTKTDKTLETKSKEIVGAINELSTEKLSEEQANDKYIPLPEDNSSWQVPRIKNHNEVGFVRISSTVGRNTIMQTNSEGYCKVQTPTDPEHIANKGYIDNIIYGIEEELTAINEGGIE